LFLLLLPMGLFGQRIEAYFSYCAFSSPESGPYIETYLTVMGNSIRYQKTENNMYQGSVNVTYTFRKGDKVETFKKYNLLSPLITDTTSGIVNFLDQQRILIPNGKYELDIEISDAYGVDEPFATKQLVDLEFEESGMSISDIELVQDFQKTDGTSMLTKSGYDIVPYVTNFFPNDQNKLKFYVELYNSNKTFGNDEQYLLKYYIQKYENQKPLTNCVGFSKQNTKDVSVLMKEFNILELPSGNYELVVEARNRKNELVKHKKIFFQRSNPDIQIESSEIEIIQIESTFAEKIPWDSLDYYIQSLVPVADKVEERFIFGELSDIEDSDMKRKFLFSFWTKRDLLDAEKLWMDHKRIVEHVERHYSSQLRKGFESDRGRVYLKYGPPNSIVKRERDPDAYPYEIWQYYALPVRANARFVFYNPDLISNEYALLHSNVFGEINDYRWEMKLNKRSNQAPDLDQENIDGYHGKWTRDLFNNPR
jgi:GWxTD domain-containing protein